MTPADTPKDSPPGTPPKHRLRYVARTDRGLLRSTNQDSVFAGDRLLVVADGMGGHVAGDTASRLVVDAFAPLNLAPPGPDLLRRLLDATRSGNAAIADMVHAHPDLDGMGTTVTAMLFDGSRAALAHVGDSRAYLYRSGVLHQLTHDDTFVQSLVDDGRITEHQAHEHPQRNLLLRALTGLELDPMLAEREIKVGDRYMLCSDGLCGVVDPESIADALSHPDPEIAADTLIQLALVAGGPDNVTTVVADVVEIGDRTAAGAADPGAAAMANDPASTNPIARLTRELPRVPLPPIPEEPAARAEILHRGSGTPHTAADSGGEIDEDDVDDDLDDDTLGDLDDLDDQDDQDDQDVFIAAGTDEADETSGASAGLAATPARAAQHGTPEAGETLSDTRKLERPDGKRNRMPDDPRRHWYRRGAVILAALVLLGVAITGATIWVRHQYYVSEQGNVVVVFRGVNGSLLGWGFSTFEETSCAGATDCTPIKVSDLQPAAQNQVRAGIKATSLSDARTVVERLSAQLLPICPPPSESTVPPSPPTTDDAFPSTASTTSSAPDTTFATEPGTPPAATAPATTAAPGTTAPATTAAPGTTAPDTTTGPAALTGEPGATDEASVERAARQRAAGSEPTGEAEAHLTTVVIPGSQPFQSGSTSTSTSTTSTSTSSNTVQATPLAPAAQIPGVTCRTGQ